TLRRGAGRAPSRPRIPRPRAQGRAGGPGEADVEPAPPGSLRLPPPGPRAPGPQRPRAPRSPKGTSQLRAEPAFRVSCVLPLPVEVPGGGLLEAVGPVLWA